MKAHKLALLTATLALPLASLAPAQALTISNLVTESSSIVISNLEAVTTGLHTGRSPSPLTLSSVGALVGGGSVVISNLLTATLTGSAVTFSGELVDAFAGRLDSTESAYELLLTRSRRASIDADSIYLGVSGPPSDGLYPWFLVDISGWDGLEELRVQNFWPGRASVVSIFTATASASVPDGGGTLVLTAVGLMALAGLGRRQRKGRSRGVERTA